MLSLWKLPVDLCLFLMRLPFIRISITFGVEIGFPMRCWVTTDLAKVQRLSTDAAPVSPLDPSQPLPLLAVPIASVPAVAGRLQSYRSWWMVTIPVVLILSLLLLWYLLQLTLVIATSNTV